MRSSFAATPFPDEEAVNETERENWEP